MTKTCFYKKKTNHSKLQNRSSNSEQQNPCSSRPISEPTASLSSQHLQHLIPWKPRWLSIFEWFIGKCIPLYSYVWFGIIQLQELFAFVSSKVYNSMLYTTMCTISFVKYHSHTFSTWHPPNIFLTPSKVRRAVLGCWSFVCCLSSLLFVRFNVKKNNISQYYHVI